MTSCHGNGSHLERQNELSYRHLPLKMAAIARVKVNNALPPLGRVWVVANSLDIMYVRAITLNNYNSAMP